MADLVDDLAGLGIDRGIVLARLQVGQHLERSAGELRAEQQGLQARDQRVAAEDRHEPGHAGGGQAARADAARAAHPQRREVGDGLGERVAQLVPRRAEAVRVLHGELAGADEAAARARLVPELRLDLVDDLW